jgi:hypothetical protein
VGFEVFGFTSLWVLLGSFVGCSRVLLLGFRVCWVLFVGLLWLFLHILLVYLGVRVLGFLVFEGWVFFFLGAALAIPVYFLRTERRFTLFYKIFLLIIIKKKKKILESFRNSECQSLL